MSIFEAVLCFTRVLQFPESNEAGFITSSTLTQYVMAGDVALNSCAKSGCSSTVEPQPSKLMMWVRFPSPAPVRKSVSGTIFLERVKSFMSRFRKLASDTDFLPAHIAQW